jgi:hypothetical protein
MCKVLDCRINGKYDSKNKIKLLSWPELQRLLMQPPNHRNLCGCPQMEKIMPDKPPGFYS